MNGERPTAGRLTEGTYALRLTRDPFFLEKGMHTFEVQGLARSRYVHPVYMHASDVEDYIWELEYECPHRKACNTRSFDSHLPTRPNETYFRYTTPNVVEVIKVNEVWFVLFSSDSPAPQLLSLGSRGELMHPCVSC